MAWRCSGWEVFGRVSFDAGVPQRSVLSPTIFPLYTNDLPDNVICNSSRYDDIVTTSLQRLYPK